MTYQQGWTYDTDRPCVTDSKGTLVCVPEGRTEQERVAMARRIAFALNKADGDLVVQEVIDSHRALFSTQLQIAAAM